jgi:hypothetical protein
MHSLSTGGKWAPADAQCDVMQLCCLTSVPLLRMLLGTQGSLSELHLLLLMWHRSLHGAKKLPTHLVRASGAVPCRWPSRNLGCFSLTIGDRCVQPLGLLEGSRQCSHHGPCPHQVVTWDYNLLLRGRKVNINSRHASAFCPRVH